MLLAQLMCPEDLRAEALVAGALQCFCAAGSPGASAAAAALLRGLEPGPRALQTLEGFLTGGGGAGAGLSSADRAALCAFVGNLRTAGVPRHAANQRFKETFQVTKPVCASLARFVVSYKRIGTISRGISSSVYWLSHTALAATLMHLWARQRREAARVVPKQCSGPAACRPACWHSCSPPAPSSLCALSLSSGYYMRHTLRTS